MLAEPPNPDHLDKPESFQNSSEAPRNLDSTPSKVKNNENRSSIKTNDNQAEIETKYLDHTNTNGKPLDNEHSQFSFSSTRKDKFDKLILGKPKQSHQTTFAGSSSQVILKPSNSYISGNTTLIPSNHVKSPKKSDKEAKTRSNQIFENKYSPKSSSSPPMEISKTFQPENLNSPSPSDSTPVSDSNMAIQISVHQHEDPSLTAPHLQLSNNNTRNQIRSLASNNNNESDQYNGTYASRNANEAHNNSLEPNPFTHTINVQHPIPNMRQLSTGSHTLVEPPQNIIQATSQAISPRDENFSIPILRLSVNPLTHDVEYNSKYDKEGITPTSSSSLSQNKKLTLEPHIRKNNFILKKSEPTVVIHHYEDFIEEINDSNTSGSTGGEKRDINGRWKENWLQQKKYTEDPSGNIQEHTFGEKSGHDISEHQRWTERWNNRGPQIEVERNVLRYDDDNNQIIEEWNETLKRDELTNFVLIDKYGTDRTDKTTRTWKSKYQEERDPEKPSVLVIEEHFQEQKGDIRKGKSYRKENGIIIRSKEWMHDASENGESWSDETFSNSTGYTWGQKSGNKQSGQRWSEKWFKTDEGDCETDRWVQEPSKNLISGEKSGFCSKNGEEYNEQWKKSNSKEEKYVFNDRWWARPLEKRRWGIKSETNEHFKVVEGSSNPQLISKEDYTEDWHENQEEFAKNECRISTEYQTTQNGHTETFETKVYKKGNRHGNHYVSSQEWNDEWTELHELDNIEKELNSAHTQKPVLRLKLKSYDKWWKENDSNCWGEKRFDDYTTNQLREEKWYFNPSGWQVDKWERCIDGTWIGEKHGSKKDGTSWNEAWKRDSNLGSEWIEKSWSEPKDDKIYKWGETTERAEIAHSKSRWTEVRDLRDSGGDFSSEKFNDDGFGNIKTEKEGKAWIEESGQQKVVNWYYNSYGENLGRSEKWAFKKGYNASGSEWVEKWNEMPSQKYSTKAGKNAAGDEWNETWQELIEDSTPVMKWAEKQGKNANGDEWMEKWVEEKQNKKTAIKRGSNIKGEKWEERWGEDIRTDGSGEKWTSKWAKESDGTTHGNSWGDRWAPNEHHSGHHWGEEWTNDDVRKWWHDTSGRPEGC